MEVLFLLWVECASIVEVCALYSVVTQVLCVVYILTKCSAKTSLPGGYRAMKKMQDLQQVNHG